eukprot:10667147-Ditylum_brightwellii.AAC.1
MSCIHDAERITNWRTVSALAKSHPRCTKYTDLDRWTPLHHTCSHHCAISDVYASLFTACPGVLLALDDKGWCYIDAQNLARKFHTWRYGTGLALSLDDALCEQVHLINHRYDVGEKESAKD